MTDLRLIPEYLVTMEGEARVERDQVVDITDGRVSWVGPAGVAPPHSGPTERLPGMLLPGFVNTHAHSPMVLLRGAGEGLPVLRWLTEVMWPREGRLQPEDVWWGMRLGAAELMMGGVTTSHEAYFYGEAVADAAADAGLRTVVTPPILTGEELTRFGEWENQLAGIVELADGYRSHPLVSVGLGPHAAYSVPEGPLRTVIEVAAERDLHIHIHVAESRHEGDSIMSEYGMTVPRYLESIGMLENRVVVAHGVWLTDDDITLLSTHQVGIAHCPCSNGKHASGMAPVTEMREAGIPVGIATDGPSSHDRLDMFEEMRWAIRLARLRRQDAAAMLPGEALRMATSEAARVLGRDDLGRIAPGSRADLIHLDTESLGPVTLDDDLITHAVYSGSPALVTDVWVGGKPVVRDGTPPGIDLGEARRQVTTRAVRLMEG